LPEYQHTNPGTPPRPKQREVAKQSKHAPPPEHSPLAPDPSYGSSPSKNLSTFSF
jgi:hypothetical protein